VLSLKKLHDSPKRARLDVVDFRLKIQIYWKLPNFTFIIVLFTCWIPGHKSIEITIQQTTFDINK